MLEADENIFQALDRLRASVAHLPEPRHVYIYNPISVFEVLNNSELRQLGADEIAKLLKEVEEEDA